MVKKIIYAVLLSFFMTCPALAMDPPAYDWGRDLPQSVIEEILERLLDDPQIDYDAVAAYVSTCSRFNYLDPARKHNRAADVRQWEWTINKHIEYKLRAVLAQVHVMNEIARDTGNVKEFNDFHRNALWKETPAKRQEILRRHILRHTLTANSAYAILLDQISNLDPATTTRFAPIASLNRNDIKLLPPDIDRLSNLEELDLSDCNFGYREYHQLPRFNKLRVLKIANSGISDVGSDLLLFPLLESVTIDPIQHQQRPIGRTLVKLSRTPNERVTPLNFYVLRLLSLPAISEE